MALLRWDHFLLTQTPFRKKILMRCRGLNGNIIYSNRGLDRVQEQPEEQISNVLNRNDYDAQLPSLLQSQRAPATWKRALAKVERYSAKRPPGKESCSFTQTLSQCLQLRSWVHGDEGLTHLLDTIIREKTDASKEDLDRRTSHVYSGSLTYRLPCPTMSRGGQSNSTSNFASHVRISSSTATAYAKKGEDYTICFQSVFLYGVAALSIMYHKYGCLPERMAVVITRGCCTWTIPPEVFTLSESLYPGVTIPTAMLKLEPVEETLLPYKPRELGVEASYAAHMAYKFAVWILNRRDTTRISTLEHRAISDTLTPPFVNLSEMCRLKIDAFFSHLVVYLMLLDGGFLQYPHTMLMELKDAASRTGFDDLIDSIILSGLTHSFCQMTHASPIDLQDREGWRIAVADLLASSSELGVASLINRDTVLIPEEVRHLFIRWYRAMAHQLGRRIDPHLLSDMGHRELRDMLEQAVRRDNVTLCTWTEDEYRKGANEIASAVYNTLQNTVHNENVKTVRLVADGCGAQNKNSIMIGMCAKWLTQAPRHIKTVELVFLIPGHSFIPPDRVFGLVEKEIPNLAHEIQTINRMINEAPGDQETIFQAGQLKDKEAIQTLEKRFDPKDHKPQREHVIADLIEVDGCSFSIAQKAREITWGFPVTGITSPVPCEQVVIQDYDQSTEEERSVCI
ncbi:hypothetical protein PYW08_006464 [Mythimna loreyi]|uniref:Uncharacterized protein n=1 Tax=Mythimna loreyi TaxID=667449 RepID=A0ACC2QMP3_9NEOP|nr:hypothetical protein PYW08_006464 [Mythimna loreyi]